MRESAVKFHAPDVAAMRALGAALARAVACSDAPVVIELRGELGAGKTTLVAGILKEMGFAGHVRSPTYTLIEPYEFAGRSVFHLDLYRLTDPHEVEPLGLRDLMLPGHVFLIEWPERGAGSLPEADITISLRYQESGREVELEPHSLVGKSVIENTLATEKPEQRSVSS